MIKRCSIIVIIMYLILASTAYSETADEIVDKLQKIYDSAQDFKADFFQVSKIVSVNRIQKAAGIAYFKKHGKMYWEYKMPLKQKFVSNGKKVWLYQPKMRQVQVFDYDSMNLSNTENSFLDGIGKLNENFEISYKGEDEKGNFVLTMIPKDATLGFKDMEMVVSKETYNILSSTTTDAYGNTNTINFKRPMFNSNFSDDLFEFTVPEGVRVVTPPQAK